MNSSASNNSSTISVAEVLNNEIPMLRYSLVGHTDIKKSQKRKSSVYLAKLACYYNPNYLKKSSNNNTNKDNNLLCFSGAGPTSSNNNVLLPEKPEENSTSPEKLSQTISNNSNTNGQYKAVDTEPSVTPEVAINRLVELLNVEEENILILTLEAIVITLIDKKKLIIPFLKAGLLQNISKTISSSADLIRIFSCQIISLVSKYPENIQAIINNFLIRPLVELLQDESNEVVLQAVFAIANISKGNEKQKQILIKIGTISSILILLTNENELIQKFSLGSLASLSTGNVFQKQTLIESSVLIAINSFLNPDQNDDAIVIETLKILVNIAKGTNDQKQEIIDNLYLKKILPLLESNNEVILRKSIQLIQHLADGTYAQKQILLDNDMVAHIMTFITYNNNVIRLYALECVSNLSKGKNSQKKFLVDNSILPVINTVVLSNDKIFQKQSLQIVQNFSKGNNVLKHYLIESGILKTLMTLINSPSSSIKKRVIKIFENVSNGNNLYNIQYLVDIGLISNIPTIMKNSGSSIKKHCLFILSNIVNNNKNDVFGKQIVIDCGILHYLKKYLVTSTEYYKPEVINATFQIIIGISEGDNNQKQAIIDLGFINIFLPLLNNVNETITTMSLRVINNVSKGTDAQRQNIIDNEILSSLPPLLFSLNEDIKLLTVEILASISNGDEFNKQAILDIGSVELIKPILLKPNESFELKKSVLTLIFNLTQGNDHQIKSVVYSGIFKLLYPLVKQVNNKEIIKILVCCVENVIFQFCYVKNFVRISLPIIFNGFQLLDDEITIHCLSAISNMTFSVEGQNEVIQYGLLQIIKYLMNSSNDEIKQQVVKIFINISAGDQSKKQAIINLDLLTIFKPLILDLNTTADAIWAIKNLTSDCHENQLKVLMESGLIELLIPFMTNPNYTLKSRTLTIFANLSEGNVNLKQKLIDLEIINNIKPLALMFSDSFLKLEIMRIVSNIAKNGNTKQQQYLIDSGYIDILVPLLVFGDEDIKQLAILTLSKLSNKLDSLQRQYLIDSGVGDLLEPLANSKENKKIKRFSKDAMDNIFNGAKETFIIV